MQIKKTIFCLFLTWVLLFAMGVPALAADVQDGSVPEEEPDPENTEMTEAVSDEGSAEEAETLSVLDEAELSELVSDFMAERGLSESNFAVAYCYTGTGESWSFNGDTYFHGASLYKLSLMMGLARKVSSGELQQTDSIGGLDISYIEKRSLTYSDNEISEMIIDYFSPFRSFRLMQAEIAGVPEEELPDDYFNSISFSSNFMLGVLMELFRDPDKYPNIVDCLLEAEPGHYFRMTLDGQYAVAQKYGGGNMNGVRYLHTAGIIYTPTPCLLVVMTRNATNAEYAIANMAQLMADYTLTLDQRRDDILAQRAEEERLAREAEEAERLAAQKAEEERLAAEEAERERQRLEAEEAARARAEAEAAASATPEPEPVLATEGEKTPFRIVVLGLGAAAVVLVAVGIVRLFTRKKAYR